MDALDAQEAADYGFGAQGEGRRREDGSGEDVEASDVKGGKGGGVAGEFEGYVDGGEMGGVGVDGGSTEAEGESAAGGVGVDDVDLRGAGGGGHGGGGEAEEAGTLDEHIDTGEVAGGAEAGGDGGGGAVEGAGDGVGEGVRDGEEGRAGAEDDVLGEASGGAIFVLGVSVFEERIALLGEAAAAKGTVAAGGHDGPSDALAGRDVDADGLVAEDGWDRGGAATGQGVEVATANGAGGDTDEEFAWAGGRQGELG